eukprot:scaffold90234_cov69-Phaeocystis_antarctica.AAC.6
MLRWLRCACTFSRSRMRWATATPSSLSMSNGAVYARREPAAVSTGGTSVGGTGSKSGSSATLAGSRSDR